MVAPQKGGCYKGIELAREIASVELDPFQKAVQRYINKQKEENVSSVNEALGELVKHIGGNGVDYFDDAMDSVYASMREIMISKQKLRGSGNIDNQGLMGVVTRMKEDKLERIMKSVKRQAFRDQLLDDGVPVEVVDQYYPSLEDAEAHAEDTLEDDLLDVANYAIICVMVLRGIWGKPVVED